jgi:hypothetical protein
MIMLVLMCSVLMSQQSVVNTEVTALVTDRTPLVLSNQFAPPNTPLITDQGDAFVGVGGWRCSIGTRTQA